MSIPIQLQKIGAELAPFPCSLIAVSKTHPVEKIQEAYAAGQRLFGENKVQELVEKHPKLPADIEWHLIGHLQRNKVKYIAPFVGLIHSVDSLKLLEEIDKQAARHHRIIDCLLQVHIAEEETKFGFDAAELLEMLQSENMRVLHHVRIVGLMGMATFTDNSEQVRKEFRGLKSLWDSIKKEMLPPNTIMKELSMGMSGDYKIALEEGSTLVRIGSAIFGTRNYSTEK
jgi:PLP dependent protein